MKVQLIDGQFTSQEALDILTQMIHVKIKFHEGKINNTSTEEDIKWREQKIKNLQKSLYEVRQEIEKQTNNIHIVAEVSF